jgi:hypothetical protein
VTKASIRRLAIAILSLGAIAGVGQTEKKSSSQKLVSPSSYKHVPIRIRTSAQAHGCLLPETQSVDNGAEPLNVISGRFGNKDQIDWAALCIINDQPEVFIVWQRNPGACSADIHSGWPLKEKFSTQQSGALFLRKATPQRILNYRRVFPQGPKPEIKHDGLEVGNEQASLVFYCDGGKWLELRGND